MTAAPALTFSVADIADAELLRRAVMSARGRSPI